MTLGQQRWAINLVVAGRIDRIRILVLWGAHQTLAALVRLRPRCPGGIASAALCAHRLPGSTLSICGPQGAVIVEPIKQAQLCRQLSIKGEDGTLNALTDTQGVEAIKQEVRVEAVNGNDDLKSANIADVDRGHPALISGSGPRTASVNGRATAQQTMGLGGATVIGQWGQQRILTDNIAVHPVRGCPRRDAGGVSNQAVGDRAVDKIATDIGADPASDVVGNEAIADGVIAGTAYKEPPPSVPAVLKAIVALLRIRLPLLYTPPPDRLKPPVVVVFPDTVEFVRVTVPPRYKCRRRSRTTHSLTRWNSLK